MSRRAFLVRAKWFNMAAAEAEPAPAKRIPLRQAGSLVRDTSAMTTPKVTWPADAELLTWRPTPYAYEDVISVSGLVNADGVASDWLTEAQTTAEDEVGCTHLAWITLNSTLGDSITVTAVPRGDGGFQVVVTDENGSSFVPPLSRSDEPLSLGQMQSVLDETRGDGAPESGGIGHGWREYNLVEGLTREELVDIVSIGSTVYPQLEELDSARAAQWVAEGRETP